MIEERSLCFIKPSLVSHRDDILKIIRKVTGLKVVAEKRITLTKEIISELYARLRTSPDLDHQLLFRENLRQLESQEVIVFLFEGREAISRLVKICGESTSPQICDKFSIRWHYCNNSQPIRCGKYRYWPNGIHRSKRIEEVTRDIQIFFPEFSNS
jgi:nucleoside diphosphate kinase